MPNIEVFSAYSGVLTNGRIIHPGIYNADDAQIADAVETMIRKGFAETTLKPIPAGVAPSVPVVAPVDAIDPDDVIGGEIREETVVMVTDDNPDDAYTLVDTPAPTPRKRRS